MDWSSPHTSSAKSLWMTMQKLTTSQIAKSTQLWNAEPCVRHLPYNPSPKLRNHCGNGGRKMVRAKGQGGREWKHLLSRTGPLHSWTHSSCGDTRSSQSGFQYKWGSAYEALYSTTVSRWWLLGKGSPRSSGVRQLLDCPRSCGWSHTHVTARSTN